MPQSPPSRPLVALVMGDPAGVSAELAARLVVDAESNASSRMLVVGDRRILAEGAALAGIDLSIGEVAREDVENNRESIGQDGPAMLDLGNLEPGAAPLGEASEIGGAFALENFRLALGLASRGHADAVCYTPFNKQAMRLSYPPYQDELVLMEEEVGAQTGAAEFNVQQKLWSARVTSHVPISGIAALITKDAILKRLRLTDWCMRAAGYEKPRIAVAGLNPHAGDGGNFGREEIEVIEPAVEEGRARGIDCHGPFSPDTIFIRSRAGEFDAVLTMYHDQGQIAMKLINFHEGVVLFGGFPFPVTTPAHGTAYDIAGQGAANPGANRAALLLAARLAKAAGRGAAASLAAAS